MSTVGMEDTRVKQLLKQLAARHKILKLKYSTQNDELTEKNKQIEVLTLQLNRGIIAASSSSTTDVRTDVRTDTPNIDAPTTSTVDFTTREELTALQQNYAKQESAIKKVTDRNRSLKSLVKSLKTEGERAAKKYALTLKTKEKESAKVAEEIKIINSTKTELDSKVKELQKELVTANQQIISLERYKIVAREREEVAKNRLDKISMLSERIDLLTVELESFQTKAAENQENQKNQKDQLENQEDQPQDDVDVTRVMEDQKPTQTNVETTQAVSLLLKQAVVRYLCTKEMSERVGLAPVIIELLHLTPEENVTVLRAVELEASAGVFSDVADWFSPYSR